MTRREELMRVVDELPALLGRLDKAVTEVTAARASVEGLVAKVGTLVDDILVEMHPPVCPKCGGGMKMRANRETGVSFWGCSAYPKCKGSLDYARWRRDADATFKRQEPPPPSPVLMLVPGPPPDVHPEPPVQPKPRTRTRGRRVPEDA